MITFLLTIFVIYIIAFLYVLSSYVDNKDQLLKYMKNKFDDKPKNWAVYNNSSAFSMNIEGNPYINKVYYNDEIIMKFKIKMRKQMIFLSIPFYLIIIAAFIFFVNDYVVKFF